jgi:chemotaxis protein MotA
MVDEELESDRAALGHLVFMRLSQIAVASGLLGTLIGLVKMLSSLDDPTTIGPAMAVSLLTLLYGVIVGEFVFKSMANSFLIRTSEKMVSSNRGHMTIYFAVFALFLIMTSFFVMLLAFADFPV